MSRKPNRLITLLTDFGLEDPFVGMMKGVMTGIYRRLQFVDLTHAVPPQDIERGSFLLSTAYSSFPAGTIHLAVVDPGVGSARRAVAIRIREGFLIGPDNGLFSGVLARSPALEVRELSEPRFWRSKSPSGTFHGRDIFAPVAAHLASGTGFQHFGRELAPETLVKHPNPEWRPVADGAEGVIQSLDHFGNCITSIPASCMLAGGMWSVQIGGQTARAVAAYSQAEPGTLVALAGSHGFIEVAVVHGHAASALGAAIGDPVRLLAVP